MTPLTTWSPSFRRTDRHISLQIVIDAMTTAFTAEAGLFEAAEWSNVG